MIEKVLLLMCIISSIAVIADKPANTTVKPAAEPAVTTVKPAAKAANITVKAAAKPANTTVKPAAKPANTTVKPAAKPANTTVKPAAKSANTTVKPAAKPANTTVKPAAKPANTTVKPAAKPANTTVKPAAKSANTTVKPAAKPANTTVKPAAKPANTTVKPAAKPANTTVKPAAKPANTTVKPAAKPAVTTVRPAAKTAAKPAAKSAAAASPSAFENVDPNSLSCDPEGHIFLLLPHFEQCTKFFMCAHGNEVEFHCAPGTVFDFVIQTCNHPWATNCTLRTRPGEEDIEGSGEEEFDWLTYNADHSYVGSVNSLTADEVSNSVRPLNIETPAKSPNFNTALNCLRSDSASRQVPYKGDCQRYWHCVNGVPKTAYCSDGLFFNEHLQQCDFEANAKCTDVNEELSNEFIVYKKH